MSVAGIAGVSPSVRFPTLGDLPFHARANACFLFSVRSFGPSRSLVAQLQCCSPTVVAVKVRP